MATTFEMIDIIIGVFVAPPTTITSVVGVVEPNLTYTKWFLRDQKLLGVLFATLKSKAMAEAMDYSSSHPAWLALEFPSPTRQQAS